MYSVTRLLDVVDDGRDRVLAAVRSGVEATHAHHRLIEPTLPGSRNGGDVLVHLRFNSRSQWLSAAGDFAAVLQDPAITGVNGAAYTGNLVGTDWSASPGTVYRTLLLRVVPGTDDATIARFEAELRLMPQYVRTITAWQLSRVEEAIGASAWTHVFEQQFTDLNGLSGPYLMHPIHWACVDRWFDPECPDVIVRDRVCHSFCHCASSVSC